MKFYDVMIKRLRVKGLINSIFELINEDDKAGVGFSINDTSKPFIGFDKNNNELVGSNDGINFFPLYNAKDKLPSLQKESVNGFLIVSVDEGFPVGVASPNGVVVPIQKDSLVLNEDNYYIELTYYLSDVGLQDDSGLWTVFIAAGTRGEPGEASKLTVGEVVAGMTPSVEITGDAPNQIINFVLPSLADCFEIVNTAENNHITVSSKAIPVMLMTNTGKYYDIKGKEISLNEDKTRFVIDISNALIVNNQSYFEGDWVVYFAGNTNQNQEVERHKLLSNEEIAEIVVNEGEIVSFYNAQGVLCTKNYNGIVSAVGSSITLGQVDDNGDFQALKFDGTTATADGEPEEVDNYYSWNGENK